jgi:hypothetical protein
VAASTLAAAQRGIALVDALVTGRRASARARTGAKKRGPARKKRAAALAGALTGPFLSPGALSLAERLRLIDGIECVIEGVYTHLPLKRARYGFDPVQRLRILRSQARELTDDAFHIDLADIVTRMRDAHTRYEGPEALAGKVAVLPFLVEMIGSVTAPVYVVTKVGAGLDAAFKPGVVLEYWNGVPIDRAVQRHSDDEIGGRPDSLRAWAAQSLTMRALQYSPPPDEHWVVVGYRTHPGGGGAGRAKEIKIHWQVVDPDEVSGIQESGPSGQAARALRRTRAVDPAAEAVRRARMLLFAPDALRGRQATVTRARRTKQAARSVQAEVVPTTLTETLKAMSIDAPGGPFGYLRIYGFDTMPTPFMNEVVRLIGELPDRGLIVDVRGNPGGYIWAAEMALQLFTPNHIEPTRFSALATPFTRKIATIGDVEEDLAPWKVSLEAAVRNGELYSQTIPITDPASCNEIGQLYGGPVVLVGDSTTYSAGDLFAAGWVDNAIGPFLCVGTATGAGGANVWDYGELRTALAGSDAALPALPAGIGLSFSFRRATRSGPSEGLPIEDVGIEGEPYAMTRNDLLNGNADLIATCIARLKQLPSSRLVAAIDGDARTIQMTSAGLDRVDVTIDGHPGSTHRVAGTPTLTVPYPADAEVIELTGYGGKDLRQRRRFRL